MGEKVVRAQGEFPEHTPAFGTTHEHTDARTLTHKENRTEGTKLPTSLPMRDEGKRWDVNYGIISGHIIPVWSFKRAMCRAR